MIGVYMIRNTINHKYYVGSSIDIESRWKQHINELNKNRHTNNYLQKAWNKYGMDNFEFLVLQETDVENLRNIETYYIKKLDCVNKGYNLIDNANFGLGVKASNEVRKKISEKCSGCLNGNYGRKHTPEETQKIRDNRWGKDYVCKKQIKVYKTREQLSLSHKLAGEKIRALKLGTHLSESTKKKLSDCRKGKTFSKDVKDRMSKARKGSKNSNCKFSKQQVLDIHEKMNSGVNYKELCAEYGISQCQAYKIKRKEHWVFNDNK